MRNGRKRCENGKLLPTPSPFQFPFVCKGKLATAPSSFKGAAEDDTPSGCAFQCVDLMSEPVCKAAAAKGGCKKHPKSMRFNCAATCGICEGIEMKVSPTPPPLPKCEKEEDTGESCNAWTDSGECAANFDYMKSACPRACGICAVDGQEKVRTVW